MTARSPGAATAECGCRATVAGPRLELDADGCPGAGRLAAEPACRATAVRALGEASVWAVAVGVAGREWTYRGSGQRLLDAAGAFATAVANEDARLARLAERDPLGAAREATDRSGPAATVARESGLAAYDSMTGYEGLFEPRTGLSWTVWRLAPVPSGARLASVRDLDTGATARLYDTCGAGPRRYHLEPLERAFDPEVTAALAAARGRLASTGTDRASAPSRAVGRVASPALPVTDVSRVLRKHTRECGLLRDLFADPAVSDVFVTAPAAANPLRVRVDGETLDTNVFLTARGPAALASRFRRESGQGFSRAAPTLDAAIRVGNRRVRVAGVTDPVSDGEAFAFRAHDRAVWRLPALVANDTMPASAAGLLSLATERGAATVIAGPRGSGKTTLLGALLWQVPPTARTVVLEDAPELPVEALQAAGRDVQALRADERSGIDPASALRSALRLGDGALVVGEVRGEEAGVLYEAMRVGANSEAVLGTIHGGDADAVLERVVSDLGVPASAYAATDLVVSLETAGRGAEANRRVRAIAEVVGSDPVEHAPLFERSDDGLAPTGRIDRGNSHLVDSLTPPAATYAETRRALDDRADRLGDQTPAGRADSSAWALTRNEAPP